jgi:hypothetical protein
MKPRDEVLGVKIVRGLPEASTPWAGVSLLVELFRRSGVVESFVLLSALGGDCVEDMQCLRDDAGLSGILGYQPPAPETAWQWLDRFHDESMTVAPPLPGSFIPPESRPLAALKEVKRRTVSSYIERGHPGWDVTLDVDVQLYTTK